jgi:hypothetical protein
MTALAAEESHSHHATSKATPEGKGQVTGSKSEKESSYTAADAVEFSRRGASMVAWPDES